MIPRFIAMDDSQVARSFTHKLKRRAETLCRFPNRGRVVPEFGRDDVRELLEGNYRLVYRIFEDSVHLLTTFEGHKLLQLTEPEE